MNLNTFYGNRSLLIAAVAIPLVFVAVASTSSNSFLQTTHAQSGSSTEKTPTVKTFSIKGYTGQSIVLPPSISQHANASTTPGAPPPGSVISGNWSVAVSNGQLQNFKWDEVAMTLNGKPNGTLSITKLTNVTGSINNREPTIDLDNNNTHFKGNIKV